MRNFTSKGYGKIWVQNKEHIKIVKKIIRDIDSYEYVYLPDDLIEVANGECLEVSFVGKFDDLDLDELSIRCMNQGIPIAIIDNGYVEYFRDK